jgi:hypothetical protein
LGQAARHAETGRTGKIRDQAASEPQTAKKENDEGGALT